VAYEIFREIRKIGRGNDQQRIVLGAHPSVAGLLQDEERPGLEALERECAAKVLVMPDEQLHLEQYDLVVM
jgi:ribonuclease G